MGSAKALAKSRLAQKRRFGTHANVKNYSFKHETHDQRLRIDDNTHDAYLTSPTMSKATKQDSGKASGKQGRSAIEDVVAREYTIHLHKRVRSV